MGFLNWKKSCVIPAWIHCLIKRLHFLVLLICEHNSCWLRPCTIYATFLFSISVLVFILFSCLSFFHFNRSVYWWWCSSSSMVCGKRWTNYCRENGRFPPSLASFVLFCALPFTRATLVLSQLQVVGSLSFSSSTVFFSSYILLPTSMEVFFLSSNILPPTSMAANSSSTRDSFFKVAQWDVFSAFLFFLLQNIFLS